MRLPQRLEEKTPYEVGVTATDEYENSTTVQSIFYMAGEWIDDSGQNATRRRNKDSIRAYLNYWDPLNRIDGHRILAIMLNGYGYNPKD